jgi:hypothetical protein|tara:strand:- start:891 stop:1115 length:225 start_codon:yes stop_codon:yes gene_type:complete
MNIEVIHAAANIDQALYFYMSVYASVAASPTINGTEVPMVAGSSITIIIKTISATAGIFVTGVPKALAPSVING